ncbi:hypothetical protein IIB79_10310 [candidate division KSB1 bacterium]|nr:hypothetical protein [candidate division KSB1 bacterium]
MPAVTVNIHGFFVPCDIKMIRFSLYVEADFVFLLLKTGNFKPLVTDDGNNFSSGVFNRNGDFFFVMYK